MFPDGKVLLVVWGEAGSDLQIAGGVAQAV